MKQILKYTLNIVLENVRFSETKHSIIISLNGALIVFTAGFFSSKVFEIALLNWSVLLFSAISMLISFSALHSRFDKIKKDYKTKRINSLLYYRDISSLDTQDYLNRIIINYNFPKDYVCDEYEKDLASEIVANSRLAEIKYSLFNKSIFFLSMALILGIVLFAIVGFVQWE